MHFNSNLFKLPQLKNNNKKTPQNQKVVIGEWQAMKPENDAYKPALALTVAYFYSTPDFSYFPVI